MKKNMRGAKLGAKLTNIALAVVLVLGMSPATKAMAATSGSGSSDVAATAAQSLGVATDAAASDGQATPAAGNATTVDNTAAVAGDSATATESATEVTVSRASTSAEGVASDVVTAAATNDANVSAQATAANSDKQATKQTIESNVVSTPTAGESDIMLLSDTGYNAGAEPVDVSNNCKSEAHLYTDSNRQNEVSSTNAVTAGQSIYGTLNIQFTGAEAYTPTYAHPNVTYKLPEGISFNNVATKDLYDGSTYAGTWELTNNVLTIKYAESYLSQIVKHFNFNFEGHLTKTNVGDGTSEEIKFPGQGTGITIPYKDGNVSGSKWSGNYNESENCYEWTVSLNVATYATKLVVTDTIGSNLSFVSDSFKLNNETITPTTIAGQVATFKLGNRDAGTYTITYKTTVNSLPTTDNTDLSNVSNTAKWTWSTNQSGEKKDINPNFAKYKMVDKSNGSAEGDYIKWTVKLNTGSIHADMGNYTFEDELGDGHSFATDKGVTVTDSSNNAVTVTPSFTGNKLSFKLPAGLGKKTLTVVYYTKLTDTSKDVTVENTSEVTPPSGGGIEGSDGGKYSYGVPKDETWISKALDGTVKTNAAEYDGKASWKTTVGLSKALTTTDASTIVVADYFSNLPEGVSMNLTGDVVLTYTDNANQTQTLKAGTDYAITKATTAVGKGTKDEGPYLFKITFKASDTVKSLLGKKDVYINYSTTSTKTGAEGIGEYKNNTWVQVGTNEKKQGEKNYTVAKEADAPQVDKSGTYSSYNADYEFADGTKGAFITTWTVAINKDNYYNPVVDLKGNNVTVTDTLPANTEIVGNSAKYGLAGYYGNFPGGNKYFPTTPVVKDGKAVFTLATAGSGLTDCYGNTLTTTKLCVQLVYQTATKASSVAAGNEGTEITNKAEAGDGTHSFPAGEGKVTLVDKMLNKSSNQDKSTNVVSYTIKVNEHASKLNGGKAITLQDTMDHRGSLINGSLKVVGADGSDLLANGKVTYKVNNLHNEETGATSVQLVLTIPDETAMTVTYNVMPSQSSTQAEPFTNTCELVGVAKSSEKSESQIVVTKSDADTSAVNYGFTINKTDDQGKTQLQGAEFDLYKVDMDASSTSNLVAEKVDSGVTDKAGKLSFGSKTQPLNVNTLYYFVETKAPASYKITDTSKHFVMLKGTDESEYQTAYNKAVQLKMTPTAATSYDVYNEYVSSCSTTLGVTKTVNGASANIAEGEKFEFALYSVGEGNVETQVGKTVACTKDAPTAAFDSQTYDKTGVYTYKVKETSTLGNGWTKAGDEQHLRRS